MQYPEAGNNGRALPRVDLQERVKGAVSERARKIERRLVGARGTSDRSRGLQERYS